MISFDEIDTRLDKLGLDRAWLTEASGRSPHSIRAALAPNSPPKNRSELLQKVLSDTIEQEEARRKAGVVLPDRLTLEVTSAEFEAFNMASLSEGKTMKDWAISSLSLAAANAASRVSRRLELLKTPSDDDDSLPVRFPIIRRGSVAAGGKSSADVEEVELASAKKYPAGHYALRVLGQSMEPTIPDGSIIVVKAFKDQGYPRAGTIVVYNDGYGSTLKVFDRQKPEADAEHASLGKIPVLKSINPEFPDVEPLEGGRIDAVFVEILE